MYVYKCILHTFESEGLTRNKPQNMGISGPGKDVLVLIGTQQVDSESIAHLQMHYPVASTPLLNELRGGDMDGINDDLNYCYN